MITVEGLTHSFTTDNGSVVALSDLALEVASGEFVAVIGPSGCGKTTFLNILAGLQPTDQGNIEVCGKRPRAGRPEVAYAPVRDSLLPWRRSVDNVALPLELNGVRRAVRVARAIEALDGLGLAGFAQMYPAQLSQGMRQRVALSRLFVSDPEVLLLDEPFSALDAQTRVIVQDAFLKLWHKTKASVILITHDLAEAITLADRVIVLTQRPGRVKAEYQVDLPRPRSAVEIHQDLRFQKMYGAIWSDLRDEVIGEDRSQLQRVAEVDP